MKTVTGSPFLNVRGNVAAISWTVWIFMILGCANIGASDAPGAPGGSCSWTTGAKDGIGTSRTIESPIWFTLTQGVLTEVFYPSVDNPNVQDLQFIVTDGATFVDLERDDTIHKTVLLDPKSLLYQQTNTAKSGLYSITKTYFTDPDRPTLLIDTQLTILQGGTLQFYVLYNPSLNNSGKGDTGASSGSFLLANDGPVASALGCNPPFLQISNGYSETQSDGLVEIRAHKALKQVFDSALTPGNLVQIAQVKATAPMNNIVLSLGFGGTRDLAAKNSQGSLGGDLAAIRAKYQQGWASYLNALKPPPNSVVQNGLTTQFNVALMALKAHGDKMKPGAHVASLTTPWGDFVKDDKDTVGYHHVWSRDLYEMATAMYAAGDTSSARDALNYLLEVQQANDGSFPRFSKVDGTDHGCCEQMDQDAFPIILAWQLDPDGAGKWPKLKLSADHIVLTGPRTKAERWEELDGLSPSTLAAEIAALICAADIARANHDSASADRYEKVADEWQKNIEKMDRYQQRILWRTSIL